MKKTILIPTDFSDNAYSAAIYAANLAAEKKWALHIYHTYTSSSATFSPEELTEELANSELLKADQLILEFAEKLATQFPTVSIAHTCERGLLTEYLPKFARQEQFALIVMGTKGKTANHSVLVGSNTYSITEKSPIPVLAIPLGYETPTVKEVGLLTNFKDEELTVLHDFTGLFGNSYRLNLLHVKDTSVSSIEVDDRLDLWKYSIEKNENFTDLEVAVYPLIKEFEALDTVPEVINELITTLSLDLLLVTKTRKTFFNKLFNKSVSKELSLKLIIPTFFSKTN